MNGRVDCADSLQDVGILGGWKRRHQVRAEDVDVTDSCNLVPQVLQPDRSVHSALLHQNSGALSARRKARMVVW